VTAIEVALATLAASGGWWKSHKIEKLLRALSAHQLKTPLSAVLSSFYLAHDRLDQLPRKRVEELLETAIAESHELDRLISGFVTLAPDASAASSFGNRFRVRLHRFGKNIS
jgi:signal transduction histidine kinase